MRCFNFRKASGESRLMTPGFRSVAERKMDVYTASPLSHDNLWDAAKSRETIYARELRQLTEEHGYRGDGDDLRAPATRSPR
jgi:hypothetical protein